MGPGLSPVILPVVTEHFIKSKKRNKPQIRLEEKTLDYSLQKKTKDSHIMLKCTSYWVSGT